MEKKGWRPGAGKRCGDFASDQAGLAHAGDSDAALAGEEDVYRFDKAGVEARLHFLERAGLDFQHSASCFQTQRDLHMAITLPRLGRSSAAPLQTAGMRSSAPLQRLVRCFDLGASRFLPRS